VAVRAQRPQHPPPRCKPLRPRPRPRPQRLLPRRARAADAASSEAEAAKAAAVAAAPAPVAKPVAEPAEGIIVMLDQITDPQNVGAIFRSALAFGARGIIVQDRHSPALAGPLAKAAVGATERLLHARVTNLSRALEKLADMGWRAVALDGSTDLTLEAALDDRPTVLVMGSEGDGVRRLVTEHCDVVARIPMPGGFESLNVSNAAAIALYEAARAQRRS